MTSETIFDILNVDPVYNNVVICKAERSDVGIWTVPLFRYNSKNNEGRSEDNVFTLTHRNSFKELQLKTF